MRSAGSSTGVRVAVVCVVVVLAAVYFLFDPASASWMPRCVLHSLTGWDCPGCGAQRMIHALLHLDFATAWEANALLTAALPYLVFWLWLDMTPRRIPGTPRYSRRLERMSNALNSPTAIALITITLIGWMIWRNVA